MSISYSQEGGGGPTTDDPFTLSDGSQGITLGARYSLNDDVTISAGYNYTTAGDVNVIHEVAPGSAQWPDRKLHRQFYFSRWSSSSLQLLEN